MFDKLIEYLKHNKLVEYFKCQYALLFNKKEKQNKKKRKEI